MYFLVQSPPPIWISRAVNPSSREIFQHAYRRGGVDFFWNNPLLFISMQQTYNPFKSFSDSLLQCKQLHPLSILMDF